jgi:outer membrane protein assembly factor BamA
VEPAATFAVNAHLRLAGGVGFSRLESLSRSPETGQVHAWIGSIGYDRTWESGPGSSSLQAGYQVRHGAGGLGSDLVYTRHTGRARYEHEYGRSTVLYTLILGGISGRAPLFERFTLGDSSTLRGWDKYDVAPAGGDRMMHQSIEYRYRLIGVFVDAGAVWDGRRDARVRLASGAGVLTDGFFLTLGFPLNADRASATLMAGVRF